MSTRRASASRKPRAWRVLVDPAAPGAHNMGVDAALLESVKAGGAPVLRLYRWDPPCLSLGRNQPARGLYDADAAARRGIDIVRRPTGGMAVYHDRELTYAVIAPVGELGSPRASYHAINRALVAGLRGLGVPAELAPERRRPAARGMRGRGAPGGVSGPGGTEGEGRARSDRGADGRGSPGGPSGMPPGAAQAVADTPRSRLTADPCFQAPAGGEVVARGRKLVGSAQRCEARTILQHGSILLAAGQQVVRELTRGHGADGGASAGAIGLDELLPTPPDPAALAAATRAGFESALGVRLREDVLTPAESERAAALRSRYASPGWVWRR